MVKERFTVATVGEPMPTCADLRKIDEWCERQIAKHGWPRYTSMRDTIDVDAQIAVAKREKKES